MHAGESRIRMSFAIIVALALIVGATPIVQAVPGDLDPSFGSNGWEAAAPAVTCDHWNLAYEFRTWPDRENPNRDSCGNLGVWHFMRSGILAHDPESYSLLPAFDPDFVYSVIGPGPNGDFYCDSTQLDVTITPLPVPPVMASPGDENWSDEFGLPWINAHVLALVDDGAGGVYLGGDFTGDANHIARWDGSQQRSLGSGTNGRVRALALDAAGNLYAAGSFSQAGGRAANNIARWDGTAWSPLGSGIEGDVYALAVDTAGNLYAGGYFSSAGGTLYAGGAFTEAGGRAANNIARWDGTAWYPLDAGTNANVLALAVDAGGTLYAGGAFTEAGGVAANYIARWDGAWAPLGTGVGGGMSPYVHALALDAAGNVYAGGAFTEAGGVIANYIARWDGAAWSGLGAGLSGGSVRALTVTGVGEVVAGGSFMAAGGIAARRVARWSGGRWHAIGTGVDRTVYAVAPAGAAGQVYAGGDFTSPRFFTRWDGVRWRAFGAGLDLESALRFLNMPDGSLTVVGRFNTGGTVTLNGVGRWDGSSWHAFGNGITGALVAIAMDASGELYVAGDFGDPVGGVYYNHVARWDGVAWQPAGAGLPLGNPPHDLDAGPNDTLYAPGGHTIGAHGWVARWDGATWQPVGPGGWYCMDISAETMAIDSAGGLYVGGRFTTAGGQPVRYVAKWDGAGWRQLGTIGGMVFDLRFDETGTLWAAANSVIARWDGAAWQEIGSTTEAWAVATDGVGHVYTTGRLSAINGVPVNNIGMWDGTAWRPLGSGLAGVPVPWIQGTKALVLDDQGNLYVGGWFITAGGKPASHIARWTASDSRRVTGLGSYTLYADNLPITVTVTQQGTLAWLYAQRHDRSHPNAGSSLATGYFWEIAGTDAAGNRATGYTVDLTLSTAFNPGTADRVCRATGSTWDCAASSQGEYAVTRTGLSDLSSFWAVQDNSQTPTPMRLRRLYFPMITRSKFTGAESSP